MIINNCMIKTNFRNSTESNKAEINNCEYKNKLSNIYMTNSNADSITFSSKFFQWFKKIDKQTVLNNKLREVCEYSYSDLCHPWLVQVLFCRDIRRLVQKGADPNLIINGAPKIGFRGDNLLDVVLFCSDSPKTIQCLLEHGTKTDHVNDLGYNVLELAERKGRKKSAEVIRKWQKSTPS